MFHGHGIHRRFGLWLSKHLPFIAIAGGFGNQNSSDSSGEFLPWTNFRLSIYSAKHPPVPGFLPAMVTAKIRTARTPANTAWMHAFLI
jgi:hypothetical protein